LNIYRIAENYTVSAQIRPDDVAAIAAAGYTLVICNRPDGEEFGQPAAEDIAGACATHDIEFHHLPFKGSDVSAETASAFRELLSNSSRHVFAYCRSGQRCAYIWSLAVGQQGP